MNSSIPAPPVCPTSGLSVITGGCLAESPIRVLVVDDYEPWRRFLVTTLQHQPKLEIVGQVPDGMEAVQEAERLRPDLILLDIGLPSLNGIEAARQIRKTSPTSKILFISDNRSSDVAEAAWSIGVGYLVKAVVGRELLPAINEVLKGKRFVSATLPPLHVPTLNEIPAHEERVSNAPLLQGKVETAGHHEVLFYSDDSQLLDHLTKFIGNALQIGYAAIVMTTESHRNSLVPKLRAYGVDFDAAVAQERYMALDAAETISTFMVNGALDRDRFMTALSRLITIGLKAAKVTPPRVAFFGEGADLLWTEGHSEAAVQDEKLCNELVRTYDMDMLCGYSLRNAEDRTDNDTLESIRAEHTTVHSS